MLRDGDGLWVVRGAHSTGSSLVLQEDSPPEALCRCVLVQALQGLYQYMLRLPMVLRSIPIYTT